jgi:serine/threonine protein kinase
MVAAAAGAVVLLLLLTAGAVRYHQYRVSKRPIDFDALHRKLLENGTIVDEQLVSNRKPRELKRSSVVLLEQVGSGAFGAVWKAMLDESATTGNPEYQVAAKTVLDAGASAEATADLTTEAAVMAQLAGHTNLVSIIGVVTSGNPLILVLSYCDHGSMLSHLKKRAAEGSAVSAVHKLDFASQTARGMEHLCGRRFIHRDLAARNVLLTSGQSASNLVCKVADFGLSRGSSSANKEGAVESEDYYQSQKGVFPVRWTAPEAMESLIFNQASDVWSFGVLLVELVQDGDRPYHDLKSNADVMALTMSGRRHEHPRACSNELYTIMLACWDLMPRSRPSFAELTSQLGQLHASASAQAAGSGAGDTPASSQMSAAVSAPSTSSTTDYITADVSGRHNECDSGQLGLGDDMSDGFEYEMPTPAPGDMSDGFEYEMPTSAPVPEPDSNVAESKSAHIDVVDRSGDDAAFGFP